MLGNHILINTNPHAWGDKFLVLGRDANGSIPIRNLLILISKPIKTSSFGIGSDFDSKPINRFRFQKETHLMVMVSISIPISKLIPFISFS